MSRPRTSPSDAPAARRASSRQLREARKAAGRCADCPRMRGATGTTIRCRACADEANAADRANRLVPVPPPRPPEDERRMRLEAGLCLGCGRPHVGLWRCARCDVERARSRAA